MYSFSLVFVSYISMIFVTFASREMVARELANVMCRKELKRYGMDRLTPFLDLCRANPTPFFHGIEGFKKGLGNCQTDFRCHRWNCTTDEDHGFKLFGTGMARGTFYIVFDIIYCFFNSGDY